MSLATTYRLPFKFADPNSSQLQCSNILWLSHLGGHLTPSGIYTGHCPHCIYWQDWSQAIKKCSTGFVVYFLIQVNLCSVCPCECPGETGLRCDRCEAVSHGAFLLTHRAWRWETGSVQLLEYTCRSLGYCAVLQGLQLLHCSWQQQITWMCLHREILIVPSFVLFYFKADGNTILL